MIEVEFGGRGHRTRLRNDLKDQLVCSRVPLYPVYKGAKGEGAAGQEEGAGGVLLLPGVGLPPPNPSWTRIPRGGKRERGAGHLLLVLIGLGEGEVALPPWAAPFSFPLRPMMAHMAPGGFR